MARAHRAQSFLFLLPNRLHSASISRFPSLQLSMWPWPCAGLAHICNSTVTWQSLHQYYLQHWPKSQREKISRPNKRYPVSTTTVNLLCLKAQSVRIPSCKWTFCLAILRGSNVALESSSMHVRCWKQTIRPHCAMQALQQWKLELTYARGI